MMYPILYPLYPIFNRIVKKYGCRNHGQIFVIVPPETPDELECMQYSQISAI